MGPRTVNLSIWKGTAGNPDNSRKKCRRRRNPLSHGVEEWSGCRDSKRFASARNLLMVGCYILLPGKCIEWRSSACRVKWKSHAKRSLVDRLFIEPIQYLMWTSASTNLFNQRQPIDSSQKCSVKEIRTSSVAIWGSMSELQSCNGFYL